jgi:hypothetical protein
MFCCAFIYAFGKLIVGGGRGYVSCLELKETLERESRLGDLEVDGNNTNVLIKKL